RSGTHYTARKETVQQRGAYWYAYCSLHGRTLKRYLGRTADLSIARLEEIAGRFAEKPTQPFSSSQPSPLLISRLHPPRLPQALVERPHLLAGLDAWRSHKLTLLWAPAGFGKTTLVTSWLTELQAHQTIANMAWVSLDTSDNDPIHFWRSIITACQTWREEIGETALAHLLSALQPPFVSVPLETTLTFFLNDLTNQPGDGILVLDDYHVIAESRLHESITFFITHLPPHLHVIILTRNEPPFPLASWRAQSWIQEFSTTDLRFSTQETAAFLQRTTASMPPEKIITQLDALLQGWPAGLRLLVLTGQMTQDEIERYLSTLDERQHSDAFRRQLLTYFVSEVLSAQPEPLQRFLLQTSGLSRLTGHLCDAVTDEQNSSALLEALERAGLIQRFQDETEPWYRYHSLFAEAMQTEARRRLGEETLHAVSRRASLWYEQRAQAVEAIEAALRAHNVEHAGILIERFGANGQRYELRKLYKWLEQIPDAVLHAHPTLCLYAAITLQSREIPASPSQAVKIRIEDLLQRAEEGWQKRGHLPWVGLVFAFRALIASLDRQLTQEAVKYATKALTLWSEENSDDRADTQSGLLEWRIICLGIVGAANMHQGHFDRSRQLLWEALALSQQSSNRSFLRELSLRLGATCKALGELHQAGEYYRQALVSGRSQGDHEDTIRALSGLTQLSLEWNDLVAAEQQINEAFELAYQRGQEESTETTYLLALLHAARGEDIAALHQLAVLLVRLQSLSTPDAQELLSDALILQTRLQLATGDHLASQRSLTLLTNPARDLSFARQMTMNILQARLQFAQGRTNASISLLEQLLPIAHEKRHMYSQLEIQLLLALAHADLEQADETRKWLQQALSQAHNEGFLRIFLAEGDPLADLLRSLLPVIREKALRSYGQTLLHALSIPGEEPSPSPFDTLPLEPLSTQEQRVLRLLVIGRTNPEIARELVISVNTVKDHVKHLYRKLGVSNRLQACEAARRMEYR
ncbi:MAG TPA: LuxR C-terminal-related transcriptional regulator, partial [Ktedonobacteraceae bacterium]